MSKSDGKRAAPKRASGLPPIEGDFPQWPFSSVDNKFLEQLGVSDLATTSQPPPLQQESPHAPHELTSLPNEVITELGPLPLKFAEGGPKENPSNLLLPASDRIADLEARIEDQQAEISRLKRKIQGLEEWAKKIGAIVNDVSRGLQTETESAQKMDDQLVALTRTVIAIRDKKEVAIPGEVAEQSTSSSKRKPSATIKTTKGSKRPRKVTGNEGQSSL